MAKQIVLLIRKIKLEEDKWINQILVRKVNKVVYLTYNVKQTYIYILIW